MYSIGKTGRLSSCAVLYWSWGSQTQACSRGQSGWRLRGVEEKRGELWWLDVRSKIQDLQDSRTKADLNCASSMQEIYLFSHGVNEPNIQVLLCPDPCGERNLSKWSFALHVGETVTQAGIFHIKCSQWFPPWATSWALSVRTVIENFQN